MTNEYPIKCSCEPIEKQQNDEEAYIKKLIEHHRRRAKVGQVTRARGEIASVESRDYSADQQRAMIVRATPASLNLTVRVFKCSSARPFPSTLSLSLCFSLL